MNRIVEVRLTLMPSGDWWVQVRKEFAPEHGGGEQWFTEDGSPEIHRALEVAKGMVTLSAGHRTDTPEQIAAQARLAKGWTEAQEKIARVKESAESLMRVTGSVEATHTDHGYTATAKRGEETTVVPAPTRCEGNGE